MFSDVNDVYDECINYPVISSKILSRQRVISVPKYLIYSLYVYRYLCIIYPKITCDLQMYSTYTCPTNYNI